MKKLLFLFSLLSFFASAQMNQYQINNWNTAGNSGTDSTTYRLGTNGAMPLILITNGVERLRIFSDGILNLPTNTYTSLPKNGSFWYSGQALNGFNFYSNDPTQNGWHTVFSNSVQSIGVYLNASTATQFGTISNSNLGFFTNNGNNQLLIARTGYVASANNMFFGNLAATPTSYIHCLGGTTSNGQIRLNSGALTTGTNIIAGDIEYVSPTFYMTTTTGTTSINRVQIAGLLQGSATLNFPNTTAGAVNSLTLTCTGAVDGDKIILGVPNGSQSATDNINFRAYVSAADVVTIVFQNNNLINAYDPASGTFKVAVIKN